jgi:hypothetical protein
MVQVFNMDKHRAQRDGFSMARIMSGFIGRTRLGRILTSFDGRRNYNEIFGWDATISADQMLAMYNRGGIAKRVIDAYPAAVWSRPPMLWAEGDDEWTAAWATFANNLDLWQILHRADKLCRLGHYSVLLIGTNRPGLDQPLRNVNEITFLQPYGETSARIEEWDTNPTSPTFGRPSMYRLYPSDTNMLNGRSAGIGPGGVMPTRSSFRVHASRIMHITRDPLEDEVFGQPMMAPVWDYLTDLRKVVGSSSESYWINANRGLQADVDKEMSLGAEDAAALQTEIQDFYDGFRRFIRTKGVKLESLDNEMANPMEPFNVLVTLISGTLGIPKRILLGSEAGQLASSEDKGNWAERVEEDRALHVEPRILKPFTAWAMQNGLIRQPNNTNVQVLWPDAYRMSPLERGQTQAQTARSIANIVKMLESEKPLVRDLLSRTEIRAILGFASDNRVLEDNPNP